VLGPPESSQHRRAGVALADLDRTLLPPAHVGEQRLALLRQAQQIAPLSEFVHDRHGDALLMLVAPQSNGPRNPNGPSLAMF
jgi:hypothetical protein